eukprot:263939_1
MAHLSIPNTFIHLLTLLLLQSSNASTHTPSGSPVQLPTKSPIQLPTRSPIQLPKAQRGNVIEIKGSNITVIAIIMVMIVIILIMCILFFYFARCKKTTNKNNLEIANETEKQDELQKINVNEKK